MVMLRDKHPGIFVEFCKGKFTVNKTQRPFSRTASDESHEQNNACEKGDGLGVGITENSSALLRWMVSGPQMSQCFRQEGNSITASSPRGPATWLNLFLVYVVFFPTLFNTHSLWYHWRLLIIRNPKTAIITIIFLSFVLATQASFLKNVKVLVETMHNMGNPFTDTSSDLLVLDRQEVRNAGVIDSVRNLKELGERQCSEFFNCRLVQHTTPVTERIPRNNVPLFRLHPDKAKTHTRNSCWPWNGTGICFQLYTSRVKCEMLIFQHENQSSPPSISDNGKLRLATKSDLLLCLEDLLPLTEEANSLVPEVDMIVLDGAAIVNMLKPVRSDLFADYVKEFSLHKKSLREICRKRKAYSMVSVK